MAKGAVKMQISLEKYEEMQDRIGELEKENKELREAVSCPPHWMHWISAKLPPEDDGEVLACNGKDVFIAHCEGDYWAVYLLNTEDDCYEQHVVKVTHWMPLPEPPEVKKMTIYEYKFQDGTTFKLLDAGFSGNEIFKLSDLHGKIILIRSYTLVKAGGGK